MNIKSSSNRIIVKGLLAFAFCLFLSATTESSAQGKKSSPTPTPTATPTVSPVATATPSATPSTTQTGTCPLPVNYGITQKNINSPEKPDPLVKICHNGFELCVPKSAAAAHIGHGDTLIPGDCTKPGNTGAACAPTPTPKPKK